jgi:hypothetical protein
MMNDLCFNLTVLAVTLVYRSPVHPRGSRWFRTKRESLKKCKIRFDTKKMLPSARYSIGKELPSPDSRLFQLEILPNK